MILEEILNKKSNDKFHHLDSPHTFLLHQLELLVLNISRGQLIYGYN